MTGVRGHDNVQGDRCVPRTSGSNCVHVRCHGWHRYRPLVQRWVQRVGSVHERALAQFLNGDIAEIVRYNRALTLAEINVVGQYFATRYGVAWTGL